MCQLYLATKHRKLIYKNKNLNMAKKTYVSPGILLLQAPGGDPGTDPIFKESQHQGELAKPGQFDDFDDDEDYRTLW